MRVVQNLQMQIGEVDVSKIKFDLKSRDDIPNIHRIGAILWQQEQKRAKRKKKCSNRAPPAKLAA